MRYVDLSYGFLIKIIIIIIIIINCYNNRWYFDLVKGLAPIHLAAKHGQLDCLKAMVERYKVDINLQSETGWTPLHLAINTANKRKALRCVTYLLQNGADPSL